MHKIQTPYNFNKQLRFTTPEGESICKPNDSWSLEELLIRQTNGLLTDVKQYSPIYHDVDHSSPDMRKVLTGDLHEREIFIEEQDRRIEYLKKRKAERKKAEAEKAEALSQTAKVAGPREERHVRDGAAAVGKKEAGGEPAEA